MKSKFFINNIGKKKPSTKTNLMKLKIREVFYIIEDESFSEMLELEGHGITINMKVGVHPSHECTEAHICLCFITHCH